MGTIIARNDTFIGGLDLIWTRVGTGETFNEPSSPLFGVGANLRLTASIVTGFGGLRIPVGPPDLSLYGIVGARNFTDTLSVTLQAPVSGFTRSASADQGLGRPHRRDLRALPDRRQMVRQRRGGRRRPQRQRDGAGPRRGRLQLDSVRFRRRWAIGCSTPTISRAAGRTAATAFSSGCTGPIAALKYSF